MRDCCGICGAGFNCEDYIRYSTEEFDMILPTPECPSGYPDKQLRKIFTEEQYKAFFSWMRGQTFTDCDGTRYDHEKKEMVYTECDYDPHGWVYYTSDVVRFLQGKPVID